MTRRRGAPQPALGLLLLAGLASAFVAVAGLAHWLVPRDRPEAVSPGPTPAGLPCPPTRPAPAATPIPASSAALIECPDDFDGRTVRYRGEVVGVVLRRGARAWAQVNDDRYALEFGPLPAHGLTAGANSGIAVSLPRAAADALTHIGGSRSRGDRVELVGTFHRADPTDGGGPTIQAHEARIIARGGPLTRPVAARRGLVAAVLVSVAAALAVQVVLARRR